VTKDHKSEEFIEPGHAALEIKKKIGHHTIKMWSNYKKIDVKKLQKYRFSFYTVSGSVNCQQSSQHYILDNS
jgi:hypothetical protein